VGSTHRKPVGDQGKLAVALVRQLERPDCDVYELFAQLDALPPDTVRAALAGTTGPSRPPEELDDDVRRVHRFAPPPLRLTCTRVVLPAAGARLGLTTAEQIERACTTWDGLALPIAARLAEGGAHSLAGAIEHRTLDDLDGMPQFDVVVLHGDSGAIFRAGTTDVLGTIAYGKVEARDRRERTALQEALDAEPEPPEPTPTPTKKRRAAPKVVAPKTKSVAPKKTKSVAPKKTKSVAPKKTKSVAIEKKKTTKTKSVALKKKATALRRA
jgi:hypothetical protein